MNVDQSLRSCLPHTFPVTLAKALGIYVQSARLKQAELTGARQGARQVKGQNSFIKTTAEITENQAENLTQREQTLEKKP